MEKTFPSNWTWQSPDANQISCRCVFTRAQQLYSSPYWVIWCEIYCGVACLVSQHQTQYGSFLSSMVQTQSSGMSAASHNIILKQKYQRKLPCLVPSGAQYIACGGGAGVLGLSQGSHLPATSQNCKSKLDECDPQQESFKILREPVLILSHSHFHHRFCLRSFVF